MIKKKKDVQEEQEKEAYDHVQVEGEVKQADDVPDGAQISKAFDTLCNIVRNRMRRYKQPEPITDFYTKGRYVLVTGESSYLDPCFYTTTPSPGHIFVTICDDDISPCKPRERKTPSPPPSPSPVAPTFPVIPPSPPDNNHTGKKDDQSSGKEDNDDDAGCTPNPQDGKPKNKKGMSGKRGPSPMKSSCSMASDSMRYEKVEVVESVEKLSPDLRVKGYEETSMVVETMIEKMSKKKHGDRAT